MSERPRKSTPKFVKNEEEWKRQLTDEQYYITREKGTERAFTGPYWNNKDKGLYKCVCCGAALSFRHQVRLRNRLAQLLETRR